MDTNADGRWILPSYNERAKTKRGYDTYEILEALGFTDIEPRPIHSEDYYIAYPPKDWTIEGEGFTRTIKDGAGVPMLRVYCKNPNFWVEDLREAQPDDRKTVKMPIYDTQSRKNDISWLLERLGLVIGARDTYDNRVHEVKLPLGWSMREEKRPDHYTYYWISDSGSVDRVKFYLNNGGIPRWEVEFL